MQAVHFNSYNQNDGDFTERTIEVVYFISIYLIISIFSPNNRQNDEKDFEIYFRLEEKRNKALYIK